MIGQGLQDDLDLSNANDLYISPDRTKIVWTSYDSNSYSRNLYTADLSGGGFQKRLLDSDVRYVEISDDLTAICYESDEKLYRIRNLGNRQEIATDVYDYEMVEETGSIYYLSNPANNSGPASSGVEQWFEDDMAVSDASLEIPDKALYHTAVTAEDGSVTYVLDKDRYYEALEQYYGKLQRDELREWVEYYGYNSYSSRTTGFDLYYFNDQGSSKVSSNVRDLNTLGNRKDAATVNYTASKQMPHYKMSEITDTKAFIENLKMEYYYSESDFKIILGGSMTDFIVPLNSVNGQELPEVVFYDLDNTQYLFYYLYDWMEDGTGTLKSVTYANGTWGEPQVLDTGVAAISVGSGGMVYQKDYNKEEETTSIFSYPQGLVDSGVEDALWSNGTLYYFKNIDTKNVTATLYCWRNNKSSLISDGVREFQPFSNGSVAVYKDYNKQQKAGNLYLWNENTGAVLMDSGVVRLKDSIYGDYYYYHYYEDYEY